MQYNPSSISISFSPALAANTYNHPPRAATPTNTQLLASTANIDFIYNAGHDTRALQTWLGHKNIQHTVRYTELAPDRFKNFWR